MGRKKRCSQLRSLSPKKVSNGLLNMEYDGSKGTDSDGSRKKQFDGSKQKEDDGSKNKLTNG